MPFFAVEFSAGAADAERWSDALLDAGALAIDTADSHAGSDQEVARYDEPGADLAASLLWPVCRLTALFANDADATAALTRASVALSMPVPAYTIAAVADDDWVRRTHEQFQPVCITPRLWIVPSWCEPVDAAAVNLRLDPGLAFGTGTHPTTRLSLRWLAATIQGGETVLDYGCGSGILAVAAAKLGAGAVTGTDIDFQAIVASRDNAELNGVDARFDLPGAIQAGSHDTEYDTEYDIVVANILANPLKLLAPLLSARVRAGGRILLSGILDPQAADVMASYRRWFTIDIWNSDEGWAALAGSRIIDHA